MFTRLDQYHVSVVRHELHGDELEGRLHSRSAYSAVFHAIAKASFELGEKFVITDDDGNLFVSVCFDDESAFRNMYILWNGKQFTSKTPTTTGQIIQLLRETLMTRPECWTHTFTVRDVETDDIIGCITSYPEGTTITNVGTVIEDKSHIWN